MVSVLALNPLKLSLLTQSVNIYVLIAPRKREILMGDLISLSVSVFLKICFGTQALVFADVLRENSLLVQEQP